MTWRVGRKVPINVYDGDTPVCMCQTPEYAAAIVAAMNAQIAGAPEVWEYRVGAPTYGYTEFTNSLVTAEEWARLHGGAILRRRPGEAWQRRNAQGEWL
jgi:hypothetical protein